MDEKMNGFWEPWQEELRKKHSLFCPKGWYGFSCGPGWKDLIDRAFAKMKAAGWSGVIHQVKEKFGTLRMYVEGDGEVPISEIIAEAVVESTKTCEGCGAPGVPRNSTYWMHTHCDKCEEEYLARNGLLK